MINFKNSDTTGFDPRVNYDDNSNSNNNNINNFNTVENNNNDNNIEYPVKDTDIGLDSNLNSSSNDNQFMGNYENDKEKSIINQKRMSIPNILSPVSAFDMSIILIVD
ncbi:unnamed protein product [[Candida] boidinii]|nr:unnamed protein product [[Candida] boidinii]